MAKGTQLWQVDMEDAMERARNKIVDEMQEAQDVPAWKQIVSFVAPFAISALLPGLGTALTGAAGGTGFLGGSKLAGFLGKGLSMGKATGAKSMLQGLISKGGAHMLGGAGIRKLLDIIDPQDKKISLKGLSDYEKLLAGKAQQESQKDINKYIKANKKNYLLSDLMAASGSLIPKNPFDIFKGDPGYEWLPQPKPSPPLGIGTINPVTGLPFNTLPGSGGMQPLTPSMSIPGVNAPIVSNIRKKNILQSLTRNEPDIPAPRNPVTFVEELFRKNI